MPSRRLVLGAYTGTVGAFMDPATPVVGGDGSVDDGSDSTYVRVRAQQINAFLGARLAAFYWVPEAVDLPAYSVGRNPRIDIEVRSQLVVAPAEITTEPYRLSFMGALSSFGSVFGTADTTTQTAAPTLPTAPPYTLTEARWEDFRNGDTTVTIVNNRESGNDIVNPVTFEDYPDGTSVEVNVYEIVLTLMWDNLEPPPRRQYPYPHARVWPPSTTTGRARTGSAAIY